MTLEENAAPAGASPALGLTQGLRQRLAGPGGLYNAGNALGLAAGLALQLAAPPAGGQPHSVLGGVGAYLAGDGAAAFLTLATAVFFVSGELYHRAWRGGTPDPAGLRVGDLLSGTGAVLLGVSLLMLGHVVLAAASGLMHAAGKLATAVPGGWSRALERPATVLFFRRMVLCSRLPAVLAAGAGLLDALHGGGAYGADPSGMLLAGAAPATLLVCYALWACADALLLRH